MSNVKSNEIVIDGCLDVSRNPIGVDDFIDAFLYWNESNQWFFGGGIKEYSEEEQTKIKPKIEFAVKGLLCLNGKFLSMHKSDEEEDLWELPGGRSNYGETAEETLVREIYEETGFSVIPIRLLDTWNHINEYRHITGIIYLCIVNGGTLRLSDEHDKYQWLDLEEESINCLHDVFRDRMVSWNWGGIKSSL